MFRLKPIDGRKINPDTAVAVVSRSLITNLVDYEEVTKQLPRTIASAAGEVAICFLGPDISLADPALANGDESKSTGNPYAE